jgi:nucleotide-binding universal stress UspA family protein
MNRILVPTDFSAHAENALKIAAQIAKKSNCEILLLHMTEVPTAMNDAIIRGAGIPEIMLFITKSNEALEKLQGKDYLKGIQVTGKVKFERPFDGILSFSNKNNIDLIVMGSRGVSGIEEVLIGSTTEKIVRFSEVPVLVIKRDTTELKGMNFVFASDFSKETKKPFERMIEFSTIFNANLALVMICTPNSFKSTALSETIMNDFIADFKITNYTMYVYNDITIEKGIINFCNSINADLLGLCTHGRTGLARFFTGSVSEDLVNHAVRPIITFKI